MLKLNDVSITFNPNTQNKRNALCDVTLNVNEGDFITMLGGNGAGKSTMLNLIAGTYLPDKGNILLDGEDITFVTEYKRSRKIGRLFQDPLKGTAPSMTIEENLALAYLRAKKTSGFKFMSSKDKDYFKQRLEELGLGLENRFTSPVGLLSGGQRQALTLLMATLVTPKLLLLDEHTAALDPATAEKVMALTKEIVKQNNITCLMVTHNLQQALDVGNRTIMMNDGKIVLDIKEQERKNATVQTLLDMFKANAQTVLDNDRMLLS